MGIRSRLSRDELARRTGRELLAAARRVFVERGYHAATLDEVASAAGFTKGVVYARYASKAELFLALVEERVDRRIADMEALPDANLATALWQQQFERLGRERDWLLVVTEFRIAAGRDRELNRRYAVLHERVVKATADALTRAVRHAGRSLAVSAEDAARLLLALGGGMLMEHVTAGDAFPQTLPELGNELLLEELLPRQATRARTRKP